MDLVTFYSYLSNLCALYASRLHSGPPLNEYEYCLYQQAARAVEAWCRALADLAEKNRPNE